MLKFSKSLYFRAAKSTAFKTTCLCKLETKSNLVIISRSAYVENKNDDDRGRFNPQTGQWEWSESYKKKFRDIRNGLMGIFMFALGMAVLSEPLYKMFCASVGIVDQQKNLTRYSDQVEQMKRVKNRRLRVNFTAD